MFRLNRLCAAVAVFVAFGSVYVAAAPKKVVKPAPKAAPKVAAKPATPPMPTGPKLLKIVAGQAFEAIPTAGPSLLSFTLCPEQVAPMTFSATFGKPVTVKAEGVDLVGPGKITQDNVSVKLVKGGALLPAENVEINPAASVFWVDVTVPRGTKPGLYKGYVKFSTPEKQLDIVPMEVNVLPLRLIGSSKQYALYTSMGPSAEGSGALGADAYASLLQSVSALGFRAIAVNADPDKIADTLKACGSAGLVGGTPILAFASGCGIPSIEEVQAVEAAKRAAGIPTLFQFCANNPCSEEEITAAVDRARLMRQAKCQVAATVSDAETAEKLLPVCHAINYRIDMPYVQNLINGGSDRTDKWEWYWWDARQDVRDNRINAGIALWRSGLYGCMPFWMPEQDGDGAMTLNSLMGMALREGVTDTRYITTYMKALRELKDKKRQADKDYIASTESYLAAFLARPLGGVTNQDLRAFRAKMVEFTNKLEARL